MEILDENLEKLLKELLDKCPKDNFIFLYSLYNSGYSQIEIQALIDKGMLRRTENTKGKSEIVTFTQESLHYFENKDKYIKSQNSERLKANIKYWITTSIAILALIASVISIILNFILK